MFETNSDIDIDDEFLNGVFEDEENIFGNNSSSRVTNDPFNIQRTQPQYLTNNVSRSSTDESLEIQHPNKENKRKHVSSPVPLRSKRERKFPGPAGLLPDRKSSHVTPSKLDCLLQTEQSPPVTTPDELCSQGRCSGSILEGEPWQSLLADLGPDKKILDILNVASIKRKAAARCFVGRKVPFLAAVLHHLDVSSPDPCIILRDSTGEIHGTLHREVWEQFAGELLIGSVLVIRNVGLLSTGISSRRHYLNITANNLVTIYSDNPEKSRKAWLHPFSTKDFNQTIQSWCSLVRPSFGIGSPVSVGSPTLFNSSLCSSSSNSPGQSPGNPSFNQNISVSRRIQENRIFMNAAHESKIRPTAQIGHSTNMACISKSTNVEPLKGAQKNLLHSFTSNSFGSSSNNSNFINNTPNNNRPFCNKNFTNSQKNISINSSTPKSNVIYSKINTNVHCNKTVQKTHSNSENFEFDSVIANSSRSNSNICTPKTSEQKSHHLENVLTPNRLNYETVSYSGNNSSKLILSESSQLSAEEQSMVEGVFDGIDVESLFDDDF